MRTLLLSLIVLFVPFLTSGQQPDCRKFRTGKFKMTTERGEYLITRKGNIQIEEDLHSGTVGKFKVTWIDPCTYSLQIIKYLENPKNRTEDQELIIYVKILEVKENSYVQETTSNKYPLKFQGELFKVK